MADRYVGSRVFSLFSELLLQLFSPAVQQGGQVCLCSQFFFMSYSFSSLLFSSCPPAAVFAHFPKCFLATKPSPEQVPNSPTTHCDIVDDDTDDDDEKHTHVDSLKSV